MSSIAKAITALGRFPGAHAAMNSQGLSPLTKAVLERAAVGISGTQDFAGLRLDDGIVSRVQEESLIGQMNLRPAIANFRVATVLQDPISYWLGEQKLKPVSKWLIGSTALPPKKIITMAVFSRDLFKVGGADGSGAANNPRYLETLEQAVEDAMVRSITKSVDAALVAIPSMADAPLSILDGLTISTATLPAGLAVAAQVVSAAGPVSLLMGYTAGLQFAAMYPGQSVFQSVVVSPAVESNLVIAYCASAIAATVLTVDLANSEEGMVEMSDSPETDTISAVSLWQLNLFSVRAESFLAWSKCLPSAVAAFRVS
ncbi:hypothetical protein [Rivibacter subsaxonicus]|uniref:HK97 family phage major capsid protein n=1 Tax=Rivibacter subsaxonicus TaxID=457575 RepID=A0A4Q7VGW2_9BURK|nr:hypothetical protein [Rivibacter subsaxonicus]RZT95296.1 hypothetical protein EV670_3048 [Rivibacter subsaxonicus]